MKDQIKCWGFYHGSERAMFTSCECNKNALQNQQLLELGIFNEVKDLGVSVKYTNIYMYVCVCVCVHCMGVKIYMQNNLVIKHKIIYVKHI